MLPFSFVLLAIEPLVDAFAVGFIIFEFAFVSVSVRVPLHTSSIPIIVEPLAFVEPCRSVNADAEAVTLATQEFTLETRVFVLLDSETF